MAFKSPYEIDDMVWGEFIGVENIIPGASKQEEKPTPKEYSFSKAHLNPCLSKYFAVSFDYEIILIDTMKPLRKSRHA